MTRPAGWHRVRRHRPGQSHSPIVLFAWLLTSVAILTVLGGVAYAAGTVLADRWGR